MIDLLPEFDDSEFDFDMLSLDSTNLKTAQHTEARKYEGLWVNNDCLIEKVKSTLTYPLNDYFDGDLSFISDETFNFGKSLIISVKNPVEKEPSYLDFEFRVFRVGIIGQKFIIGCQIFDQFDKALWKTLI